MDVSKYKILETDFNGKGVSAQPNPMQKTEEEAKAVFDELVKDVVTPRFNAFVDAFQDVDLTSDKDKPVSDAQKEALDKKVDKELRTGSTEEYKVLSDNNYSDEERDRVYNTLAKDNKEPFEPTGEWQPVPKKYVDDKVLETGAADMQQAVYDPKGEKKDMFAHERLKDNPHGVTLAQVGGSNHNLLDNWYFADPINQRGKTEYTGLGYTIDRWCNAGTDKTVHITNDGLHFPVASDFYSNYENNLCGKTITLSVLTDKGVISATGTMPNAAPNTLMEVARETVSGIGRIALYSRDKASAPVTFHVSFFFDAGITALAAKLEYGSQQTLARQENGVWVLNDAPPNKALEMAKCQRYFQTFATQSLRPTDENDFRPVMRTTPALGTIAVNGKTLYTACADL